MRKITTVLVIALLVFPKQAFSAESLSPKIEIIGKTHDIFSYNSFSGAGFQVPNLASTFDMSIFELNWGGKQALFNGSGITTNSNFPLKNGEAFTQNTDIGLVSPISEDLKAGFLWEIYSLTGNRTVGRVFGEELPWDNFSRENGAIQTPHFQTDFYNGFLEGGRGAFKFKLVGGVLSPRELPEFTRKEMNQVKLGSLVYRAPITNASFFEKEDRKIEEGRHPLKGVDVIGDYEYREKKHLHLEIFTGNTQPTPLSDIERDAYGGRASADLGEGNVGFTYVYNDGVRPITGFGENQSVWSVDASYNICPYFVPYFTFAETGYERENTGESHRGNAVVAGALLKFPNHAELKGQFQRLEENYDLMAYHKTEHYPANFQGLNIQGVLPITEALKIKGTVYHLEQIETVTTPEDTIFGDSFFASAVDSKKGTIGVERIGADWKWTKELSWNGYVEHAKFRKTAATAPNDIDKDIYNFYGGVVFNFTKGLSLEGSFRHFFSVGNWQTMNFRSYQDIVEAALSYKIDKDRHAMLIYHNVNFEDNNAVSLGRNDYYGHQIIFEIRTLL